MITFEQMYQFDKVYDYYMKSTFGSEWRTMCHQSAKIATKALTALYPTYTIETRRVELVAMMEGSNRFVHIGYHKDEEKIPGKFPGHFAVLVGGGLYDPSFYQLKNAQTPLDIPHDGTFFYSETYRREPADQNGFKWFQLQRPGGILHVGYMLQDEPLNVKDNVLLSDGMAKRHARRVFNLFHSR